MKILFIATVMLTGNAFAKADYYDLSVRINSLESRFESLEYATKKFKVEHRCVKSKVYKILSGSVFTLVDKLECITVKNQEVVK